MRYLLIILLFIGCTKQIEPPIQKELNHDGLDLFLPKTARLTTMLRSFDKLKYRLLLDRIRVPKGSSVILLDFDGGTVSNTSWNYNGDIVYEPANLTPDEQQGILDSMRNDYSPFDLYVTTKESEYNNANQYKRMRVIFTTSNEWYGSTAGGVSYTGSFTWGDNTPCWVFTDLLNYNQKSLQEAGSHEAGHTLTLRHQAVWSDTCTLVSAYNFGGGGWAPIMGVGYYQNNVTWHTGPTPYACTDIQDDRLKISNIVGYK